ncbi:MAG: hypothetical protein HRT70_05870 [Flavobacteriaceae bacterium]|nr:hypothetical protein [Flavobacteriaceae bacterium]
MLIKPNIGSVYDDYRSEKLCYNFSIFVAYSTVMSTVELKNIITESLKSDDSNLFKQIVEVIENYKKNKNTSILTDSQKKELDVIRERHISGESRSYSWQEIKQELMDKHGLQA